MTGKQKKSLGMARIGRAAAAKIVKTTKREPLYDFVENGARLLNLKVDRSWLPAVVAHLRVTLRHGATVEQFAMPDETDPAPVFEP
jgi:hypothetical protein